MIAQSVDIILKKIYNAIMPLTSIFWRLKEPDMKNMRASIILDSLESYLFLPQ